MRFVLWASCEFANLSRKSAREKVRKGLGLRSHFYKVQNGAAGVEILSDDFSLRERGIAVERLAAQVKATHLDVVIDRLAEGRTALWH
jgi:predicted peroxiredoxin